MQKKKRSLEMIELKSDISKRIEEIALDLTGQLSVVGTEGELDSTNKVYEILSNMDYYKKNPNHLRFIEVEDDRLGRKSVMAILKGEKSQTKDCLVMIGHSDTVGISDYGQLKDYANKPHELAGKFKEIKDRLDQETREDLESGDYLFGRGIFDMKTGLAILMANLEEISKDLSNFSGNLIFAALCDEEENSKGMLSLVPELIKLKEEEGFNYLGLLDADYMTSEYPGDKNKYVYIGTVGKLMPSFYIVGKETHVGEAFKGLDPNQISSAINKKINLNVDYSDLVEGELSLPPISLKQRDLKKEYSVQTAGTAHLFFNYSTHISTPDQVLEKMKDAARLAFEETIDEVKGQYKRYCQLSGRPYQELPWQARVLDYNELYEEIKSEMGEKLDGELESFSQELLKDEKLDERDFSLKMVEKLQELWSNRDPVVIVYFTPPYYPHIYVEGNNEKERKLLEAVEGAVKSNKSDYDIVYKKFFPYISDLSYASAPKDQRTIKALKNNMPGFGSKYKLPLGEMQELDLAVVNIGPFGKDAHKFTERVEKNYSFNVAADLVYKTISNLFK